MKGVRFERLGTGRYYNVILHVGSTYVPVSDETVAELKTQTLLSPDRFLDLLIQKIGYSSYLKEQIRNELKKFGCSEAQGWLYGRAVSSDAVRSFLSMSEAGVGPEEGKSGAVPSRVQRSR